MPKNSRDFPCTINLGVSLEMKQALVAAGYYNGEGGEISSRARNYIKRAHDTWLFSLTPAERKEYDQILANVKITVTK